MLPALLWTSGFCLAPLFSPESAVDSILLHSTNSVPEVSCSFRLKGSVRPKGRDWNGR